jgi:hypothetical protein
LNHAASRRHKGRFNHFGVRSKSWNPPHQVTYQNAFRFYGRSSNGKYQLDVDELRSIFSLLSTAGEKIKLFRVERVAKIVSGDAPVALQPGAKAIVHILPLSAFTVRHLLDLRRIWMEHGLLANILRHHGSAMFNVDGLLFASRERPATRYAQVFRDGCIELVSGWSDEASKYKAIPGPAFESALAEHVHRSEPLFSAIGISPPIVVMITLLGVKGWKIMKQGGYSDSVFDRDPVFIPELVLESFGGIVRGELKPLLDFVWNAAGDPGSPSYDFALFELKVADQDVEFAADLPDLV